MGQSNTSRVRRHPSSAAYRRPPDRLTKRALCEEDWLLGEKKFPRSVRTCVSAEQVGT